MLFTTIIPLILIIAVLALVAIDIYRHRHPKRKKPLIDNQGMADIHDMTLAWFKSGDNDKAALSILVEDTDENLEQMSFAQGSNQLLGNALMNMMLRSEDMAEFICGVVDQYRKKQTDDSAEVCKSPSANQEECDSEDSF